MKFRIIIRSRFGATKFRLFSFRHRIYPAYERRASTAFRRRTGVECRGRISLPRYLLVIGTNLGLGVILLIYSKYWSRYEVGLGNRLRRACRKRACRNILGGGSGTSVVERVAGRRQVRPVINRNFRFFRSLGRVCGFFLFGRRRAAGRNCSQKNGGGGHPSSAAPVFHR